MLPPMAPVQRPVTTLPQHPLLAPENASDDNQPAYHAQITQLSFTHQPPYTIRSSFSSSPPTCLLPPHDSTPYSGLTYTTPLLALTSSDSFLPPLVFTDHITYGIRTPQHRRTRSITQLSACSHDSPHTFIHYSLRPLVTRLLPIALPPPSLLV